LTKVKNARKLVISLIGFVTSGKYYDYVYAPKEPNSSEDQTNDERRAVNIESIQLRQIITKAGDSN
jgi:hypothetical protein